MELGDDATVDEGSPFVRAGLFVDPDPDHWTATVDYGDGGGAQALARAPGKTFELSHTYADNGVFTVTVVVEDDQDAQGLDTLQVTVGNKAPEIGPISGPDCTVPYQSLTYSVPFTDPGTADTHSATVDWGDGSPVETAAVNESGGQGTATANHTYTALGTYTIAFTVTDDDGGSAASSMSAKTVRACVVADPQQPGELALLVGGSSRSNAIYLNQLLGGDVRVKMSLPNYSARLRPSPGGNVYVYAGPGNDVVWTNPAFSRDMLVYAGTGNDHVHGTKGDGLLDGEGGNDTLRGNGGNDVLLGGSQSDWFLVYGTDSIGPRSRSDRTS